VWKSLLSLTFKDFEWIVVNDGSTDGIEEVLNEFKSVASFPVTIIHQNNQGKHIAWNKAVEIANGELFVPADSDDEFIPETLEIFSKWWNEIPMNERQEFSGINVLCMDSVTKQIIGSKFPKSPFISNNLDLVYIHKITGEKWGCIRTDCLRLRRNPEIPGTHMPEGYIWFWLARRFKVLCIDSPLRVYYQNEPGNISSQKNKEYYQNRLQINYVYLSWHLTENIDYLLKYEDIFEILKNFMIHWKGAFYLKFSPVKVFRDLKSFWPLFFAFMTLLPGVMYFALSVLQNKK